MNDIWKKIDNLKTASGGTFVIIGIAYQVFTGNESACDGIKEVLNNPVVMSGLGVWFVGIAHKAHKFVYAKN